MPQVACSDDRQLKEFLDGRMTQDAAAELERHVEACPRCLAVLERLIRPPGHWTANLDPFPNSTTADQEPSCQSLVDWICDLPKTVPQRPSASPVPRRIETNRIGEYDLLAELGTGW